MFDITAISFQLELILQLVLAVVFGGILGAQRESIGKAAGLRTYILVTVGATLFMIVSKYGFLEFADVENARIDPARIAAQVVTGIGFIGAGLIIFRGNKIEGLTTAAGLWSAAAIGMTIAAQMYVLAAIATLLVFVVLEVMGKIKIEERLRRRQIE